MVDSRYRGRRRSLAIGSWAGSDGPFGSRAGPDDIGRRLTCRRPRAAGLQPPTASRRAAPSKAIPWRIFSGWAFEKLRRMARSAPWGAKAAPGM